MSQPRRRRRRRRKPGGEAAQKPRQEGQQVREQASDLDGSRSGSGSGSSRSRNRRRRRKASSGPGIASPKSSEDLVRALPKERPAELTAPPDGQSLDNIIGELQSNYGVPAYPQEYRITIKVAEEKPASTSQPAAPKTVPAAEGAPKREKAPAAPRVGGEGPEDTGDAEPRPAKRRRGRRRRGRGRGSGPSGGGPSAGAPPPPPPPPA